MNQVQLKDKKFSLFIEEERILASIVALAEKINIDYKDKNPLFIGVLNGSFMFASDLLKNISLDCEISFVKISSYDGTSSTGKINNLIGLNQDISGRDVIVLEDIVDTGNTIENLYNTIIAKNPNSIKFATLLLKPDVYKKSIKLDYVAISIANDFIVGYGLDYDGLGRNLRDIYKITK